MEDFVIMKEVRLVWCVGQGGRAAVSWLWNVPCKIFVDIAIMAMNQM